MDTSCKVVITLKCTDSMQQNCGLRNELSRKIWLSVNILNWIHVVCDDRQHSCYKTALEDFMADGVYLLSSLLAIKIEYRITAETAELFSLAI